MKRIIDFQTHLGDMFNEARFVSLKKPGDMGDYPDPLGDFEKSGFKKVPKADAKLVKAMQNRMWEKGNIFSAGEVMDENEITYFFNLPVYPNTSFDECRGASTLDQRLIPFTSPDFELYTVQMAMALNRDFDLGAKGMYIHAALQNVDLASDQVAKAVTVAGERNLPIVVYYGGPLEYPESPLFPRGTKPQNTALDKVLNLVEKLVKFKFVLVHGPSDVVEVEKLAAHPNVYVTTAYSSGDGMLKLVEKFGVDRVLFGSDYPFASPKISIVECEKAFTGDDLKKIMFQNAVDLVSLYA